MDPVKYCANCGMQREHIIELTPDLTHYGKIVCNYCGRFDRWVPKPDSDASKYRRPNEHKDLVRKYSQGFCELCLLSESELRPGTVLVAHHVIEFQNGGTSDRSNVWILCSGCHSHVHWMRRYVGHSAVATKEEKAG